MSFRARLGLLSILSLCFFVRADAAPSRTLTFAQRVDAQRAIDRVRYSHQIGASVPFEAAVPFESTERRVREALKRSVALARHWNLRVTGDDLRREAARVARSTRMPERLAEMYASLGNDPVLIQEVLLRPRLEERLAAISGAQPSWDSWWQENQAFFDESDVATIGTSSPLPSPTISCVPVAVWDNGSLDDPTPVWRAQHHAVWTGSLVLVIGNSSNSPAGPAGERYDPVLDEWSAMSETMGPGRRIHPSAVWTGTRMIVWGGRAENGPLMNDGRSYDPVTDTWQPVSSIDAPPPRQASLAVWTGTRMIVWGGRAEGAVPVAGGGSFDPATNTWTSIQTIGAPGPRRNATAVWAGGFMLLWGGVDETTGGLASSGFRYDPVSDSWSPMSVSGAPPERQHHSAVSTGGTMLVWGGGIHTDVTVRFDDGARYHPATDSWSSMTSVGAPPPMHTHTGVWTGDRMIVWGQNPGGSYDPVTDSWSPLSTVNAPASRTDHAAVWAGDRMVIWGGQDTSIAQYDPAADAWTTALTRRGPSARRDHAAIWTGTEMIVWGGQVTQPVNTGGRYDPALDSWTEMSRDGAPSPRYGFGAVWTGSEMIVWGGHGAVNVVPFLNDGARYDPIDDTWTSMAGQQAPSSRYLHAAVWTGTRMIVWGGVGGGANEAFLDTGGRYDPATDQWSATRRSHAPDARRDHSAVWTGTEMIVWGGRGEGGVLSTGARYDPSTDAWQLLFGGPMRYDHEAIWTGTEMIVWGGIISGGIPGGDRYSPAANAWLGMADFHVRENTTAVWTGSEMIVWNGSTRAGGHYDPDGDSWQNMSNVNAPAARRFSSAVWADTQMIVWGGQQQTGSVPVGTGGRFMPQVADTQDDDGDSFSECGGDCDDRRASVFPGAPALCDGVNNNCSDVSWPNTSPTENDADLDGWRICAGDCDDLRSSVYPGSPEVCDGLNNDCNHPQWPLLPSAEQDIDNDGHTECGGDCSPGNPNIYPGAPPICDGLNNDCNDPDWPSHDDETDVDADLDGFCSADCDDSQRTVYPGAPQACDGLNNNCNDPSWPEVPLGELDWDGDGAISCADCEPTEPTMFPFAPELCDGLRNNCIAFWSPSHETTDFDGDGLTPCQGDCHDQRGSAWAVPSPVILDVAFDAGTGVTTLAWSPPSVSGGTSVLYDVLRAGEPFDLTVATCSESDEGDTFLVEPAPGPVPFLTFYLVRTQNGCLSTATGGLGYGSNGTARVGPPCD